MSDDRQIELSGDGDAATDDSTDGERYRLPGISPRAYEHPADRAATAALRKIPLLDVVLRKLSEYQFERAFLQMMLANSVRIGPDQLPRIWNSYQTVLDTLDMPQQYALYISQTPVANAFTLGSKSPIIVVQSGLVSLLDENEVRFVLAHEVGHILSDHSLHRTALVILLRLGQIARLPLLVGLPTLAIELILLEWFRAAELSADRAATLAIRDPLVACRSLMNLAGGAMSQELNVDAFIRQANEYEEWESRYDKSMRFLLEIGRTHPFPVRRVSELMRWVQTGDYDRIVRGDYIRRSDQADPQQDVGEGVRFYNDRFQAIIREVGGGVQDFGRQLSDWLKRNKDKDGDDKPAE
jgi:Zn-dependent protease with chaperone function